MTAEAIAQLRLARLELAVLSACETNRGSVVAEGASSGFGELTSAFLLAGAHGVVGSLWRVGDTATSALMIQFHARLAGKAGVAAALAVAQRGMVRKSPAEWAAFRYVTQ